MQFTISAGTILAAMEKVGGGRLLGRPGEELLVEFRDWDTSITFQMILMEDLLEAGPYRAGGPLPCDGATETFQPDESVVVRFPSINVTKG